MDSALGFVERTSSVEAAGRAPDCGSAAVWDVQAVTTRRLCRGKPILGSGCPGVASASRQ